MIVGVTAVLVGFGAFLWWWDSLDDRPGHSRTAAGRLRRVILRPVMITVALFLGGIAGINAFRGPLEPIQIVALFLLFWLEVAAVAWGTTVIHRLRAVSVGQLAILCFAWLVPLAAYVFLAGLFIVLAQADTTNPLLGPGYLVVGGALLVGSLALEIWSRRRVCEDTAA